MSFPTFNQTHREPILCWLVGVAGGGKSTLALDFFRENQPGVIIPMDQRFDIYRDLFLHEQVKVYPVSDPADPAMWASADHILAMLRRNFPGSGARSIVWDSTTPGFREKAEWAMAYADKSPEERVKALGAKFANKAALYQPKAHYMEQVAQIANYGTACLWISHEHEGRDKSGQEAMKTSISEQERKKFRRNINLTLKMVVDDKRYGIEIVEARARPSLTGKIFWDGQGQMFKGMWQKIADAFYGSPVIEMTWESFGITKPFPSIDVAIELGSEFFVEIPGGQKFFPFGDPDAEVTLKDGSPGSNGALIHARNAYEKLRNGGYEDFKKPGSAGEMAEAWKMLCERKAREQVQTISKAKPEPAVEPVVEGAQVQEELPLYQPEPDELPLYGQVQEEMF